MYKANRTHNESTKKTYNVEFIFQALRRGMNQFSFVSTNFGFIVLTFEKNEHLFFHELFKFIIDVRKDEGKSHVRLDVCMSVQKMVPQFVKSLASEIKLYP